MDTQKVAIALAKTIEHLAEKNLILEDSLALSYDGHAEISPYEPIEVENVIISFNSIRGFAETFKKEILSKVRTKGADNEPKLI